MSEDVPNTLPSNPPALPPPVVIPAAPEPADLGSEWASGHVVKFTGSVSPFLSPEDIRDYREISPEIADRFVSHNLAAIDRYNEERAAEAAHRRAMAVRSQEAFVEDRREKRQLQSASARNALGAVFGMIFLIGYFGHLGHDAAGATLGCGVLVALAAKFHREKSPTAAKAEPLPQDERRI